jgi:radical SAM protein with 4Fe4S-binding SPASM domain
VVVVRPDNLYEIAKGLEYVRAIGVRRVNLSLDLWTRWTANDVTRLDAMVTELAGIWFGWLPEFSVNWFDAKVTELAHLPGNERAIRCGFGSGEVAVAPSGRLYPCERVVGEDRPENPLRLTANVFEGPDFLTLPAACFSRCEPCSGCALNFACDTFCRCSNFIRTGDVNRPDGLLCALNKSTARAVAQTPGRRQFGTDSATKCEKEKNHA